MAASMKLAMQNQRFYLIPKIRQCSLFVKKFTSGSEVEQNEIDAEYDKYEEKVARLRDCSGMTAAQKRKYTNQMPILDEHAPDYLKTRKIFRKLYAKIGSASGINPGIMYPSKEELTDLIDIEKNWTSTFHQLVEKVKKQEQDKIEEARLREKKVEQHMAKMPELMKKYNEKLKQLEKADDKLKEKTQKLLDQFREKYGYSVKENNPKFHEFRQLKKEEEKMALKQSKKEERKQFKTKQSVDAVLVK